MVLGQFDGFDQAQCRISPLDFRNRNGFTGRRDAGFQPLYERRAVVSNDPARRRALIEEYYTEDCVFYDPNKGSYRGRDEIDRIAGVIKATQPDFQYQPIAERDVSGNGGRIRWVSGVPGQAPAYAGTDFIVAQGGRIAAVYLFFDKLP